MGCLDKRVALVNGATSPLGRAVAHALAVAGADLMLLHPRREDAAIGADLVREVVGMGRRAVLLQADAATDEGAYIAIQTAIGGFGAIDILIGDTELPSAPAFMDLGMGAVDGLMRGTLAPLAQLSRLVLPQMAARGYGRLIATLPAAVPGSVDAVLAGALTGYVQALAAHLPGGDITANGVAVSPTVSGMSDWSAIAAAYVTLAREEARAWRGRVL